MAATNETSISNSEKESLPPSPSGEKEASNGDLPANTDSEDSANYPSGFTLGLIVGSVMMSVFLIALDQVSDYACAPKIFPSIPLRQDRQLLVPQFPKSRTSFAVSHKYLGTAPRTS